MRFYFLGILLLLFIAAIGAAYLYYRFFLKRRYSRERFAFIGLATISSFLITAMFALLARGWIEEAIVAFLNNAGFEVQAFQEEEFLTSAGFTLGAAMLLAYVVINLHRNWQGAISLRESDKAELGQATNIFNDAHFSWNMRGKEIPLAVKKELQRFEVFPDPEQDTRPWHVKAATLLNLWDSQYDIDIARDWYREHDCFISNYGRDKGRVAILCTEQAATKEQLDDFIRFCQKQEGDFQKRIIATMKGDEPRQPNEHQGLQIEFRYQQELLNSLIRITHYRREIDRYFGERHLENSQTTLNQIYVPLGGHTMKVEKEKMSVDDSVENVEAYILNWLRDTQTPANEHLAVLGEYGQGKTVLSYKLVKEMLSRPNEFDRIPILISLRGRSPRNDSELDILSQWASQYDVAPRALDELHRAGKLFLILDGFDEMDLVGDTQLLRDHFSRIWGLAKYPNARILITGRQNLFTDDTERRAAIGIHNHRLGRSYAKAIYLDKMSREQTGSALREVAPATRDEILAVVDQLGPHGSFVQLISRPSTLYQLSTIWDQELAGKKERLNSAEVISRFLDATYDRQQQKQAAFLTSNERDYFMMGIAVSMMMAEGDTNQIRNQQLEQTVAKLWEGFPEALEPYTDAHEGDRPLLHLSKRLKEQSRPLDTLNKDIRAAGILVHELSGRDTFAFAHKSYMEFLVSKFYAMLLLQTKFDRITLIKVNAIRKALNYTPAGMKYSSDIQRFSAEHIAAQVEITENGQVIPVKGNEVQYDRYLRRKLSSGMARWFPNIIGWLSFHPAQKFMLYLSLASLLLGGLLFILPAEGGYGLSFIEYILLAVYLAWGLSIWYFNLHKEQNNTLYLSPLHHRHLIYHQSAMELEVYQGTLQTLYLRLIRANLSLEKPRKLIIHILALMVFVTGLCTGTGTVAVAVAVAGTVAVPVAVAVAVAAAAAVAFAVAFASHSQSYSHSYSYSQSQAQSQ